MLRAGNKQIIIYGDPNNLKKVKTGNAKLTEDGYALYSIIDENVTIGKNAKIGVEKDPQAEIVVLGVGCIDDVAVHTCGIEFAVADNQFAVPG